MTHTEGLQIRDDGNIFRNNTQGLHYQRISGKRVKTILTERGDITPFLLKHGFRDPTSGLSIGE